MRLDDLGGERFEYDEENLRLVAKRSGFAYSIGDPIRIQVVAADPELGQINFGLAGLEKEESAEGKTSAQASAESLLKKLHSKDKELRVEKGPKESRHFDRREKRIHAKNLRKERDHDPRRTEREPLKRSFVSKDKSKFFATLAKMNRDKKRSLKKFKRIFAQHPVKARRKKDRTRPYSR